MLKDVGFGKVEVVSFNVAYTRMPAYFFMRVARAIYLELIRNEAFLSNINCARRVFHAWN
jgi:hypothetical protein